MILTDIRRPAVRFEFAALPEIVRAARVLADPKRHAEQMAWVRYARRRMTPALRGQLTRLRFLLFPAPELFVNVPFARDGTFAADLALLERSVQAFERALVRRMHGTPLLVKGSLSAKDRAGALARACDESGTRSVAELRGLFCSFIDAFFTRCVAPQWDAFAGRARDDARAREELARRFGLTAMLRTLTRHLAASGTTAKSSLRLGGQESASIRIPFDSRASLTLTPSFFIWPNATFHVLRQDRLDVRIAYPVASPASVRSRSTNREQTARRFAALGDPVRLHMLDLLSDRDLSTREFAGLIGLSEGGVSRHLSILREAGLVTRVRDGYFVLYRKTALAKMIDLDFRAGGPV